MDGAACPLRAVRLNHVPNGRGRRLPAGVWVTSEDALALVSNPPTPSTAVGVQTEPRCWARNTGALCRGRGREPGPRPSALASPRLASGGGTQGSLPGPPPGGRAPSWAFPGKAVEQAALLRGGWAP